MAPFFDLVWRRALRPLFFTLDPELAHRIVLTLLAGVPAAGASADAKALGQNLWGMRFTNPVGLAAGLDKDAAAVAAWQMLGFGLAEVGTITPQPQPGNPRPRLWRLPEHRALINRLGFPSLGMEVAGRRLERLRGRGLRMRLGINIGPNKDTPPERVADGDIMPAPADATDYGKQLAAAKLTAIPAYRKLMNEARRTAPARCGARRLHPQQQGDTYIETLPFASDLTRGYSRAFVPETGEETLDLKRSRWVDPPPWRKV